MQNQSLISTPVCLAPTGDRCGEGPVWHAASQSLYWTDINRFLIHCFDTRSQSVRFWHFDEPVCALALTTRDDTLAVALGSRLILWQPASDARHDHLFRVPGWPAVRSNDGRPDPRGSFWLGTMRNNVGADGSSCEAGGTDGVLYRIDADGAVSEWKRGIGISNTVCWSPDGTHFYFADSLANRISVFDYDANTGAISHERVFFEGFPRGLPDGSAMDSEGCLWNCRYGGSCVARLGPDGGIDHVLEMPTANITSCTFGGEDGKTLFITTAADKETGDRLMGSLFAVRCSVRGLPENRFRISAA